MEVRAKNGRLSFVPPVSLTILDAAFTMASRVSSRAQTACGPIFVKRLLLPGFREAPSCCLIRARIFFSACKDDEEDFVELLQCLFEEIMSEEGDESGIITDKDDDDFMTVTFLEAQLEEGLQQLFVEKKEGGLAMKHSVIILLLLLRELKQEVRKRL